MKNPLASFVALPFGTHLIIGTLIRLFLILFGLYLDQVMNVSYTDVDYRVFTDAARHIVNGESPYLRHTYRYSPILALLLTPNVLFNQSFGKILFSFVDIIVGVAIKKLVKENKTLEKNVDLVESKVNQMATNSALIWIYNPLTVVIATRGNADSLASFLVIMSLLFHETTIVKGLIKYFISGIFLGLAIHLRIYPIVFSLPMFLALGHYKINRNTRLFSDLYQLIPNRKQIALTLGCVVTLVLLTVIFYIYYGYEFLFETYFYHMFRKDIRHNFSFYFYLQYIGADYDLRYWQQMIPVFFLIIFLGMRYGRRRTLNFALLAQVYVFVSYNTVLTTQYFVWILSLLPLSLYDFQRRGQSGMFLFCCWLGAKAIWLYFAYLLEFKGKQMFLQLFLQSSLFFATNIYILGALIRGYTPGYLGYNSVSRVGNKQN